MTLALAKAVGHPPRCHMLAGQGQWARKHKPREQERDEEKYQMSEGMVQKGERVLDLDQEG